LANFLIRNKEYLSLTTTANISFRLPFGNLYI